MEDGVAGVVTRFMHRSADTPPAVAFANALFALILFLITVGVSVWLYNFMQTKFMFRGARKLVRGKKKRKKKKKF